MKKLILATSIIFLSACSTIHTQVADWPELKTTVHENTSGAEILHRCYSAIPLWQRVLLLSMPVACAEVDLVKKTCDVYLPENVAPYFREHEMEHCKGGDHDGIFQAEYDRWVKAGKP